MTEQVSTYSGKSIEIVYDRKLCIHAAECGRGSSALFDARKDPWCDPNAVPADEAADIVSRCPTGALTARRDGIVVEADPERNVVTVSPDGPLYVHARLEIEGRDASPVRVALCRCGASKNKPFCDNAHKEVGFRDAGPVGERGEGAPEEGGTLRVKLIPDGPLLLRGNLTIRAGSGRDAFSGANAALCRCGESKNKPFCDGTHAKVGFRSD